jgi:hypothetical protein
MLAIGARDVIPLVLSTSLPCPGIAMLPGLSCGPCGLGPIKVFVFLLDTFISPSDGVWWWYESSYAPALGTVPGLFLRNLRQSATYALAQPRSHVSQRVPDDARSQSRDFRAVTLAAAYFQPLS